MCGRDDVLLDEQCIARPDPHSILIQRMRHSPRPPGEFSSYDVICVNPVRRASFQELHQFLYREGSGKVDQRVNVICVYMINFHVNPFLFRTLRQVARNARRTVLFSNLSRSRVPQIK
jgi:hypothetical protein